MTRWLFLARFERFLPSKVNEATGQDRIISTGRVGEVPVNGVMTNILMVEADDATLAELAATDGWERLPDPEPEVVRDA